MTASRYEPNAADLHDTTEASAAGTPYQDQRG